ncbi:uncharacterized protein OCT59_008536 [Rhizophagus irregularis]|uniref:uncharacterized protein n=1 Tax=Rhizophagus irregularis TaxID=588596 RepID=UPI000CC85BAC|nr:hypothetical protein OCT59_008536 [Rhizophagus irregularis]
MQLTIKDRHDIVLEWIPYNQFVKIKKINENGFITGYSAIWGDGPFYKNWWSKKYTRDSNKELTLNCLCNSQYLIEFLINETKKYLTNHTNKHKDQHKLYGISQNPYKNDYILVQNNFINLINWTSGNKKIGWIPYDQFDEIKETGRNSFMIVYSAIWKDCPLYSQVKEYSTKKLDLTKKLDYKILKIYGIFQNPDTNDYILVQNVVIWISGNEKIDSFIQKMQVETNDSGIVFEWIPYNQFYFIEIEETGKNGFMTVYSAILWKDGPLYKKYRWSTNYTRDSNKEVDLRCLHTNSQTPIESLINEVKKFEL